MAKSLVYRTGAAPVGFNLTPMIDVTFQLIIFFMLATQTASAEYVQMKLPRPWRSVAEEYKEQRAIVNVVPYDDKKLVENRALMGLAKEYRVRADRIDRRDVEKLSRELQRLAGARRELVVEVRADQRIAYGEIEPVLRAIQAANLDKMRITALLQRGGGEE